MQPVLLQGTLTIRITTDVYAEQRVRAEVDTTALLGGEVMQKKTA